MKHNLEHVIKEASFKLLILPLALPNKERFLVDIAEWIDLPNGDIRDGYKWSIGVVSRVEVLEVPKGMSGYLEPSLNEVVLNARLESIDLPFKHHWVIVRSKVL